MNNSYAIPHEISKIAYEVSKLNSHKEELKKQAKDDLIQQFAASILTESQDLNHRELTIILWDLSHKLRDIESQ